MTTVADSQSQAQALATATALAARFYTESDIADLERRAIFARHWQLVAGVSRLAAGGDHVVSEIAGVPILVVRGEDGRLRGFSAQMPADIAPARSPPATAVAPAACAATITVGPIHSTVR